MRQQLLWAIRKEKTGEEARCVLRKETISPSPRVAGLDGLRLLPDFTTVLCSEVSEWELAGRRKCYHPLFRDLKKLTQRVTRVEGKRRMESVHSEHPKSSYWAGSQITP